MSEKATYDELILKPARNKTIEFNYSQSEKGDCLMVEMRDDRIGGEMLTAYVDASDSIKLRDFMIRNFPTDS